MSKSVIGISLFMTIIAGSAFAQAPTAQEIANQASQDSSDCLAFYSIGRQCVSNTTTNFNDAGFMASINSATKLTYMFGKTAGMSDAALLARIHLSAKGLMSSMDNDCVNVAVILDKYADSCKALLEHPEARLNALLMPKQ
jgi:hypothetical protein